MQTSHYLAAATSGSEPSPSEPARTGHVTVSCRCATAASPRVKGSQVDDMAVAKNEFRADRCQGGVCKLRRLKALYTKFRYK
jgi:hypothetical protein